MLIVIECLRLSDVIIIYMLSTRVGRRSNFREVSCTECTFQGNDFQLMTTVEMESRNPVVGYFGSEFQAICDHAEL